MASILGKDAGGDNDGNDGNDGNDEPCCAISHERYVPSDLILHSSNPA